MKTKKTLSLTLAAAMTAGLLVGCGGGAASSSSTAAASSEATASSEAASSAAATVWTRTGTALWERTASPSLTLFPLPTGEARKHWNIGGRRGPLW